MSHESTPQLGELHQIWYFNSDGDPGNELAILRTKAEIAYAERMFGQMYGDCGPVEITPANQIMGLPELIAFFEYDPEMYDEDEASDE